MKKHLIFFTALFMIVFSSNLRAQEEKPKVALVLSGGGAKGIAHIPLLQALDSLGIVPDLIIGTSMGSVVGGFYAAGYSGDTIETITNNADWGELLGGDISLVDVSMEEKSEFKRHLLDFDLIKGKPKMNTGLLKDQKLREFLTAFMYPVFNVDDFDDLPIPFRAMTTDIVSGKEVLLEKGSIGMAMRASMSIPGVFLPVPYNNTLLVDGGVLNNFPVDVAKELGADIIIGSDVGGGMQKKEDLNSIPALLFQAAMLTSNLKNPDNRELCDVLIDHVPYLTYSTGDFTKSKYIYEEGKIATKLNIVQLVSIAEQLKKYKQRTHKLPDVKDEFILDTVVFNNISEANIDLVKARANITTNRKYSTRELIDAVDRAMGTNLFSQITYEGVIEGDKLGLELNGFEHSQHQVKGALHFDSFRSGGLILNYTGRNVIGKASRLFVTLDIAVQPRFKVQYQKLFGVEKDWWWRSEVLGEFLKQKMYLNGQIADNMNSTYFHFDNQFNKNLNSLDDYVGIDISYEYNRLKPEIDPDINDNILDLREYTFHNYEVGAHYLYSKMDRVYFPNKGSFFRASIGRSIFNDLEIQFATDDVSDNVEGSTNGFTKLGLDYEKRFVFNKKITGIVGANANFIIEDALKGDDLSFTDFGYAAKYSMGGVLISPRKGTFVFPGLHEDEVFVSQLMKINLGLQMNPFSKVFITPHINFASVGFGDFDDYIGDAFSPSGHWTEGFETSGMFSAGVNFAYHSFLGPLIMDFSWVNDIDKVRVFFSIGLQLNRSN